MTNTLEIQEQYKKIKKIKSQIQGHDTYQLIAEIMNVMDLVASQLHLLQEDIKTLERLIDER
jgi:hypothetical protein